MKKFKKSHLLFLPILLFAISAMADGFMITESLRKSESDNFDFGGDPVAILTAGRPVENNKKKVIDPNGDGWLRLTKDTLFQRGYAVVKQKFPSTLGVQIDLEFKIWRTNKQGADGFSIFLFKEKNFKIGGFGGSLGYAQFTNYGASHSVGLSGGFVGIGIDEFGNYSKGFREGIDASPDPTVFEGRVGGDGFHDNCIGVRGPAPEYLWQTGNPKLGFKLLYDDTTITKRPSDTLYYRRIQIDITPGFGTDSSKYAISARMKTARGAKFFTVLNDYVLDSIPPDTLQLGFAASTGAGVNYHELRNLYITTPRGVRVTKEVDKLFANVGDSLTYNIDVYNQTDSYATDLFLKDEFDEAYSSNFQIDTVLFKNNDYTENVASPNLKSNLSKIKFSMEPRSQSTFIIKGRIVGCKGLLLNNMAISSLGKSGIIDPDVTNDTARVSTIIRFSELQAIDDRDVDGHGKPKPYEVKPDSSLNIDVLSNDWASYYPKDPSSVHVLTDPAFGPFHGSAVESSKLNGTVDYYAEKGFAGLDSFQYSMSDGDKTDTATVFVEVMSRELKIPNVFTPNGDNINDFFEIIGIDFYDQPEMRICNRWGDEVFYNTNYKKASFWDGGGLNEGTYFYWLRYKYKDKVYLRKGWVLLKR